MSIIFCDISYFLNACVGYVRMDLGSGKEFRTTSYLYSKTNFPSRKKTRSLQTLLGIRTAIRRWGNRGDLNDSVFKADPDAVVNQIRKEAYSENQATDH